MKTFKKHKGKIVCLTCISCLILGLIFLNRTKPTFLEEKLGSIVIPFQKINTAFSGWIKDKYNLYFKFEEVEKENEDLKLELAIKEQQLTRLKQLEKENKKLLELLEMSSRYGEYEKVAASIIAKEPGNWYNTFTIDKGYKDGLAKDMVVIASKGLVGIIKECGKNYSKVVSIIDDINSISSKTLRTDDIGFIRGDLSNKGFLKMEYIDSEAEIVEGDEIITSHLSETYHPGIPIGYVTKISLDKNNLSKIAVVKPYVDFKHLENVLVITTPFKENDLKDGQE